MGIEDQQQLRPGSLLYNLAAEMKADRRAPCVKPVFDCLFPAARIDPGSGSAVSPAVATKQRLLLAQTNQFLDEQS